MEARMEANHINILSNDRLAKVDSNYKELGQLIPTRSHKVFLMSNN